MNKITINPALSLQTLDEQSQLSGKKILVGALIYRYNSEIKTPQIAPQIYVQKRSLNRKLFPGCWDLVGGHVEVGETLTQALAREIKEETGWTLFAIEGLAYQLDWEKTDGSKVVECREFDFLVQVQGELDKPLLEAEKHDAYMWVGSNELEILVKELVVNGKVQKDTFVRDVVQAGMKILISK